MKIGFPEEIFHLQLLQDVDLSSTINGVVKKVNNHGYRISHLKNGLKVNNAIRSFNDFGNNLYLQNTEAIISYNSDALKIKCKVRLRLISKILILFVLFMPVSYCIYFLIYEPYTGIKFTLVLAAILFFIYVVSLKRSVQIMKRRIEKDLIGILDGD